MQNCRQSLPCRCNTTKTVEKKDRKNKNKEKEKEKERYLVQQKIGCSKANSQKTLTAVSDLFEENADSCSELFNFFFQR